MVLSDIKIAVNWFSAHYSLTLAVSFILCFVLLVISRFFRTLFLTLIISLLLFEITIALMLNFPPLAKFGPRAFLHRIYMESYRNIIQCEPDFARYDPYLKYTLKPGVFLFHNPEYNNEFRVNSLGVRDDEAALVAPEVVVVGDSVPMGWGVNQNETFAKLIEKRSGLRVLNAAISSYSTVQAMRMLDRIDISKMKYLIIYYENWKYPENLSYYMLGNKFKTVDRETYERASVDYNKAKKYFPMKYAKFAFRNLRDKLHDTLFPTMSNISASPELEAKVFVHTVINASSINLDNIEIIILCENDFVEPLKNVIASQEYPSFIKKIIPVAQPEIKNDYAYTLDDHPASKWHKFAADKIIKILNIK